MTAVALIRSGPAAGFNDMLIAPLGLMYLSATIRRHGYQPQIIDLKVWEASDAEIIQRLQEIQPEVVGLGAFTPDAVEMHRVATLVRSHFPKVPIIAGGPHASADPQETLSNTAIDYAVMGEGEETFLELLNTLAAGRNGHSLNGLAWRDDHGAVTQNPERAPIMDMDSMPFPAWDLIDIEAYKDYRGATPVGKRRFMSIFTSRACPYKCTYCHTIFGKKFRARSPDNVIAEIRELRDRFGISVIEVSDDIFNLQWKRAHAISSAIASSDLDIRMSFPNGLRADIMRPELMKSMKAAGTYFISYAIESGSPRIQKLIKKNLQLERTREVIAQTVDAGIYTNGFFMMGFPSETRPDIEQTIEFARSTRLHSASFFILVPFVGTEIHKTSMSQLMPIASDQAFNYHSGIVNCSAMENQELLELKRKAYVSFYFGRGRIIRTVARHPEKRALGGLALSVLKRMELKERSILTPA